MPAGLRPAFDMRCPACEGMDFIERKGIRIMSGGSVVHPPRGYACLECRQPIDMGAAMHQEDLRRLEDEVRDKQEQLKMRQQSRNVAPEPTATATTRTR